MKFKVLKLAAFLLGLVVTFGFIATDAQAARCTVQSDGVSCTYQSRDHWYWCNLIYLPRPVKWQVPEGTAPSRGWPVVYWYEGTVPTGSCNVFQRKNNDIYGSIFGLINEVKSVRELLDNPAGTGSKYAVLSPQPPQSTLIMQFWNTNVVFPYSASCDYDFFNNFFPAVDNGTYGAINNNKRFATGVSSGGYNSSRMAITFNGASAWKALAVVSASYADCSGSLCALPCSGTAYIPENHPPTKFYHGTTDIIVPIFTMRCYYDLLLAKGKIAAKQENGGGHGYSTDILGANGTKAWFDKYNVDETPFGSSILAVGQSMPTGKYLASPSGVYQFVAQYDGNLVLYHGTSAIWASNTAGRVTTNLKMQIDGNLVLYNGSTAVWASGTNGQGNATLEVQNDGNTVIYKTSPRSAIWSTKTMGK